MLRDVKRRFLYVAAAGTLGLAAIPFLPSSFAERMQTIESYRADQSASTRLAVWGWTLDYVKDHPFGGGFGAYRQNRVAVNLTDARAVGAVEQIDSRTVEDAGRAWHSSYFEMLGEQGWPGLAIFLVIHLIGLARMEVLRRRYARREDLPWASPLATALQHFHLIYLLGGVFVQTAFQPFGWLVIGVQMGFDNWLRSRERAARRRPFAASAPAAP